jgi:hypothetical protein
METRTCGDGPQINRPDVVAEVGAALARYEQALCTNDIAVLDAFFWDSPHTVRYGATENLYGYQAIRAFRAARPAAGLMRTVLRTSITTFGSDLAATHLEFARPGAAPGRQSQTWVRFAHGWRIVAAHVSLVAQSSPAAALPGTDARAPRAPA